MRHLALILSFVAAVGGGACKQAVEPPSGHAILQQTRTLSARMCACPDKTCGTPLRAQWDDLTKQLSGVTFTAEQVEGLAVEDQRFMRCMEALDR